MKIATAALVAATLSSLSHAHMIISSPSPIPGSAIKDPLAADGSNFPCHGISLPTTGGTPMAVGSTQLLAFNLGGGYNTATHGGGSCQISITYDTDPAKVADPSNWYVIYSIEEGCPTNSPANLDGGGYIGTDGQAYSGAYQCNDTLTNGFDCVNQFNFEIPDDVMNGNAIMAWTWFNTVGNREMYMNCVNVDITGGASDMSGMSDLPAMFVANVATTGVPSTCGTVAMENLLFPDPGQYLTTHLPSPRIAVASASSQYPFALPTGCPANVRAGSAGTSVASAAAASSTSTTTTSIPPTLATSTAAATTLSTATKQSFTSTKKSSTSTAKKTSTTKKAAAKATKTSSAAASSSAAPSAAATSSSCATGSVPCSTYDAFICIDSTHWGLCDTNNCAVSQAVAPGTMCMNGAISWAT